MNNRKLRKLKTGAAMLCFLLLFGAASALSAAQGAGEAPAALLDMLAQQARDEEVKELITLAQVRAESRLQGTEARQARLNLNLAQAGLDAAKTAQNDIRYAAPEAMVYLGTAEGQAAVERVRTALEDANIAVDDARAAIRSETEVADYNGEALFFQYLYLKDAIGLLEKSIALNRNLLRIEQLSYQIGLSSETDVQRRELALAELEDRCLSLINSLDLAGRNLLQRMGRDANLSFRLDPAFSIEGLQTAFDPDQLAASAVRANLNLDVLNRTIDDMAETIRTSNMAPSSKNILAANRDSLVQARSNATKSIDLLARSTATGLDAARTELDLLEKRVGDKQRAYDLISLQLSLGMAPRIGVQGAELELLSAKNDLLGAQRNYYLSLRRAALLLTGVAINLQR